MRRSAPNGWVLAESERYHEDCMSCGYPFDIGDPVLYRRDGTVTCSAACARRIEELERELLEDADRLAADDGEEANDADA